MSKVTWMTFFFLQKEFTADLSSYVLWWSDSTWLYTPTVTITKEVVMEVETNP
jgi:hypothetical protein